MMLPTSTMMLTLRQLCATGPFVDDKGRKLLNQVNMVKRDIDLAYHAYFPTAPKQSS
ncbi:MAG: hypothetical protein ACLS5G_00485 [Streptococcus sp.]